MVGILASAGVGDFAAAAAMTFAIPIGILGLAVVIGFFQRKPLPDRRRHPLFPLSGIPQRAYDLAIVAALHDRRRTELVEDREVRTPAADRPVGE